MKNYLQNRNNNHMEHTSLFDALDDFFRPVFADEADYLKSNISETDKDYRLEVAVPGFTKEQIKLSLENGYSERCMFEERKGRRQRSERRKRQEGKQGVQTEGNFRILFAQLLRWRRRFERGHQGEVRKRHSVFGNPESNAEIARKIVYCD